MDQVDMISQAQIRLPYDKTSLDVLLMVERPIEGRLPVEHVLLGTRSIGLVAFESHDHLLVLRYVFASLDFVLSKVGYRVREAKKQTGHQQSMVILFLTVAKDRDFEHVAHLHVG